MVKKVPLRELTLTQPMVPTRANAWCNTRGYLRRYICQIWAKTEENDLYFIRKSAKIAKKTEVQALDIDTKFDTLMRSVYILVRSHMR